MFLLMVEPSCTEVKHVCGELCDLVPRDGCLATCSKVRVGFSKQPFSYLPYHIQIFDHPENEHLCASPVCTNIPTHNDPYFIIKYGKGSCMRDAM